MKQISHPSSERSSASADSPGNASEIAPDNAEQTLADVTDDAIPTRSYHVLPVVGLGGSAGCLKPLQEFFAAMAPDSGMAFVVIMHLSPEHESALAEILQRSTRMPVLQVAENTRISANRVYVISPRKHLSMMDGHLTVSELQRERGRRVAVDLFFRTLADTHGPNAIAVVLSGGDSDGSVGIKRVKERGGLTIIQDPQEAEHIGMPRSALETGMVDWILRATEMPDRIMAFRQNSARLKLPRNEAAAVPNARESETENETALRDVLLLLRTHTGRDFAPYKRATVLRRIARRMQVNSVQNLREYHAFVRTNPGEAGALLHDLLISVTNFFRDREAFAALTAFIPEIFKGKSPGDAIRVWVPACATGEEAYSIAILLSEHAATLEAPPQIQVFATDIDEDAISVARAGNYSEAIAADVSEARLRRFFTKHPGNFRINQAIREMVLFAVHDLLKDAPFSRLDLISCRNLLIYLTREAQSRAFETFHFASRPDAGLLLGLSETAEDAGAFFSIVDKKNRLYRRRNVSRLSNPVSSPGPLSIARALQAQERVQDRPVLPALNSISPANEVSEFGATIEQQGITPPDLHVRLIETLSPPSLVINRESLIVHLSANVGRYLQFGGGTPTNNVVQLVHPALRADLRAAIFRATQTNTRVNAPNLPVEIDGARKLIDLSVRPAPELATEFLLVVFTEHTAVDSPSSEKLTPESETLVRSLERELEYTKQQLRNTLEQHSASTEEMKASNEELQAMNEELRSASEELETSREELQSINEELTTVNAEMKSKVDELARANSDLQNLMGSTNIATVFLDRDLRINRYTRSSMGLFNFIPTDMGRPISDLAHRFEFNSVVADAEKVLRDLTPIEREVRSIDKRWFLARLTPYRTIENQIAGVVLTFIDITERKEAEDAVRASESRFRAFISQNAAGICGTDLAGRLIFVNQKLCEMLGWTESELLGRRYWEITQDDGALNEKLFDQAKDSLSPFRLEKRLIRKDGTFIWANVSVAIILGPDNKPQSAVAVIVDTTERVKAADELRRAGEKLEGHVIARTAELNDANRELRKQITERIAAEQARQDVTRQLVTAQEEERGRISRELHDEVGQHLTALMLGLKALSSGTVENTAAQLKALLSITEIVGKEIHDLAVELRPTSLDDLGLLRTLTNYFDEWSMRTKVSVDFHHSDWPDKRLPSHIETVIYRIICEALNNVSKHAHASAVSVILEQRSGQIGVIIEDNGTGFDEDSTAQHRSQRKALGLVGMKERAALVDGDLKIESKRGKGTTVFVRIPLPEKNTSQA